MTTKKRKIKRYYIGIASYDGYVDDITIEASLKDINLSTHNYVFGIDLEVCGLDVSQIANYKLTPA